MTQLSDADRKFAVALYEADGSGPMTAAFLTMKDAERASRFVATARVLRDAEREPEIAALRAENARGEKKRDRMRELLRRWCQVPEITEIDAEYLEPETDEIWRETRAEIDRACGIPNPDIDWLLP